MALPGDLDALCPTELKALVVQLLGKVAALEQTVAAQRAEIVRLKGLKGRPQLKPSGMEEASEPKPPNPLKGRRGPVTPRVAVEDQVIEAAAPPGSRFKGYADFLVQDLVLRARCIRYRRERWLTPDGRLVAQLQAVGLAISKRQVMRLLIGNQQRFLAEARDVLRAGLAQAPWITVDDTGARHKAANGTCTQIGNDHFAWFGTTASKSRLNFLGLLRAGYPDYAINAEALAYMRERALAGPLIERLATHPEHTFPDRAAWQAHLERLGITDLRVNPDPVRIATEGALWGAIKANGFLPETVIVSDDAGQFMVGCHALCWVHAERLVHKLDTFTDHQRRVQQYLRALIWWFYRDLKAYRREPTPRRRTELRVRFDRIFGRRTGFVVLDRLLARLHANKPELLRVLDRPEIPLHTNGSENDIRAQVIRRKVSGGPRSDIGRDCRDAFLGLMKTCQKLGVSFWDYLGTRLAVPDQPAIPYLPDLVRIRS